MFGYDSPGLLFRVVLLGGTILVVLAYRRWLLK
jgi:hypothetical protein